MARYLQRNVGKPSLSRVEGEGTITTVNMPAVGNVIKQNLDMEMTSISRDPNQGTAPRIDELGNRYSNNRKWRK